MAQGADSSLAKVGVKVTDSGAPLSINHGSVKPMEKKKKRKALDKERQRSASDNIESESIHGDSVAKSAAAAAADAAFTTPQPGSVLPEFHIDVFKDLASADACVRESASKALVTELYEVQKSYVKLKKKGSVSHGLQLEAEKNDGLDDCAPSCRYAVRRLIRGVSSSRECARQGFALGLTILVAKIPSIKIGSLLELIVDLLEVSSSMKGQEVRDCLLGRLFAYGALAQSGRVAEEWSSCKSTPHIKKLVSHLLSLAAKKRYLQEPSVSVILEMIEQLPVEALLNHVVESPLLQEWFEGATKAGNPDALLLALKLHEKVPQDIKFGGLLPCPFSPSKFFAPDHLSSLLECFKESTFCQPRVHSLWHVLVNILLPDSILQDEDSKLGLNPRRKRMKCHSSSSSEDEYVKNFRSFYEVVIEGSLLLSSHDRKHLVFDFLLLLLPKIPVSFVPIVFSYKLVQCLMDILSTKDSWLFKAGQYFLKELSDWVSEDAAKRVSVIVAIQKHSNGKFDCITRTKTIRNLMAGFNTESDCMLLISNLVSLFVGEDHVLDEPSDQSQTTDDNSETGSGEDKDSVVPSENVEFLKNWIIESLSHTLKYSKLDPEPQFHVQKEILKFFAVQGIFSASLGSELTSFELQDKFKWPKTATSRALCGMCINQIQLLLANVQKSEGSFATVTCAEANDLGSYFMDFFVKLRSIPSVSLFRTLNDDDVKAMEKLLEMENRLYLEETDGRCRSVDGPKMHALRYLLIQLLLQVLLRPMELSETAFELTAFCNRAFLFDHPDLSDRNLFHGVEVPLMDVLIDLLLSLLPQSSAPLRVAIGEVFRCFCFGITDDGLLRMLQIIKRDLKPARHKHVDSDDGDNDDFLDIEEAEESEAETGETVESDGQSDDSEKLPIAEVAGKELPEVPDDSDDGMDDDEMFRMDSYIAQIFKERKSQGGNETAQSQLFVFKLRILSLLEIFLHEHPGRANVLTICSHLAQAFVNPHIPEGSEQFEQRIWGILHKKIFKAKDYPKLDPIPLSTLESLLERNLKLASKPFKKKKLASKPMNRKQSGSWNRHKMIVTLAQNLTFWILKIIDGNKFSEPELQGIYDIISGALTSFLDSKKSQLKSMFLKEIIRRRPWVGHHLFGFFLEKCRSAKFEFRQVEALDVVAEMLKSLVSSGTGTSEMGGTERARKILKKHLPRLCDLMKALVTNMPKKPSRRAEVRKFCGRILQTVSNLKMVKGFLVGLDTEAEAALESQIGEAFLGLRK